MFRPDQPIQTSIEDKLNRTPFAYSLAEAILDYGERESLVVGLFGAWGSGKTSILNIALEHITSVSEGKSNEEKPIIVRFNPWNYSEQNQLITQFFKELSVTLKRTDYASGAKALGKEIEIYSKLFDPLILIPTAGSVFMIFSILSKSFGSAISSWGEAKSKDLATLKNELNASLDTQRNKIIIVIDDIDRLSDVEIRQMFQLIKSVGDFHNTIYVLAFDKNVVAKALNRLQEGQGMEYLEKVIQVPFEVPLIPKQQLEQLLESQLNELVGELPQERIDPIYWGNIYHGSLKHFFKNMRDINRYLNSVKFGFSLVKDELYVIDYLAITAIQVFIPSVYYGIRENKELFSGIVESTGLGQRLKPEQAKIQCDEIISRSTVFPQEHLKELLTMLFPKLAAIYSNMFYGYASLMEWRREGRICSPAIFDTFFRLSIQEGDISRNEIEAILSLANDSHAFAEALLKLNEEGRVFRFLERLEDYIGSQIPLEDVGPIITALMDVGDLFPEGYTGPLSTRASIRILRLVYQLSQRFDRHDERFRIFKDAIEKATKSLYTMVNIVSAMTHEQDKYGSKKNQQPDERLMLNAEQLKELEKLVCMKIKAWDKDGRLAQIDNLPEILFSWQRMGGADDVNEFVNNMIRTDDGLINFITSFLSAVTSQGVGSYVASVRWHVNLKSIGHFVDAKDIEPRIRKLASASIFNELDERKKLAIMSFLDTVDGKIENPFQKLD